MGCSSAKQVSNQKTILVGKSEFLLPMRYASGETPKPPTNPNFPRLYSHNLCLFSERARLSWAAKGIKFQHCEVDLQNKAKWHVDVNGGTLPFVELPSGQFLLESRIIQDFANDYAKDQGLELYSKNAVVAAQQRLLMEKIGSFTSAFFPLYRSRGEDPEMIKTYAAVTLKEMEDWLKANLKGSKYLLGHSHPTMPDIHVIPIFERLLLFENSAFDEISKGLNIRQSAPTIYRYVSEFRQLDTFKPYYVREDAFHKCVKFIKALPPGQLAAYSLSFLD
ncbi:glutathione transferase omega-1 [Stylonychia lemnae]|uniref:Glutathione transferase omega-1 n=1 Tax=Stylonychia lemnae TaxID=5949 RepID=A0A078B4D2_STYLE|nr:glutathione transferase omega-1 [Stylonychia lemnae]|eukprot:CDW89121.1 glutathione transferase omega-1 [Stylonychia lemnae]